MYSSNGSGTLVLGGGTTRSISGSRASLYDTASLRGSNIVLFPISHSETLHRTGAPILQAKRTVNADMAISNFHIQFDRSVALYQPGDDIKGKVIMDVWSPVTILFIELKIQGYGTVRQFNDSGDGFSGKPIQEFYINKRVQLLSPPNGNSTMLLQQGKYVSEFSYKLPHDLPPTVSQFDLGKGFVFDISYQAKANVCDLMRSRGGTPQVSRVVKNAKATFAVSARTDLDRNEEAIVHTDTVQLFCSPFSTDPTSVLVQLNKSIYTVGEYIRVHIELTTPNKKRVVKLVAELEQTVTVNLSKKKSTRFQQILIKAVDDGRDRKLVPRDSTGESDMDTIKTGFRMPIPPNFVPSELPNCDIVRNSYAIKVSVKFARLGGTLIQHIPISIIPPSDAPVSKKENIPLFNKPIMQFPYFAKDSFARDSMRSGRSSTDTVISKRDKKHDNVSTKYKTCITCCGCCLLCLGYGIYD